jgi:hypothetical protein
VLLRGHQTRRRGSAALPAKRLTKSKPERETVPALFLPRGEGQVPGKFEVSSVQFSVLRSQNEAVRVSNQLPKVSSK